MTGEDAHPRWSPDGKRIAFDRSDPNAGTVTVWTMNADGTGGAPVTAGTEPAWSPDGRWLAYSGWGPMGHYVSIYKIRLGTTRPVQVTHPKRMSSAYSTLYAADSLPAWSPDGTTIAYVRYLFESLDGTQGLMAVTGGVERTLIGDTFGPYDWFTAAPSWGPGGKYLLYADEISLTASGIYQLAPGGTPTLVLAGSGEAPVFSPHLGTQIVYEDVSTGGLYVAAANGTGSTLIVAGGSEPDWQPIP